MLIVVMRAWVFVSTLTIVSCSSFRGPNSRDPSNTNAVISSEAVKRLTDRYYLDKGPAAVMTNVLPQVLPKKKVPDHSYLYDPVFFSLGAALESRAYDRGDFKSLILPLPKIDQSLIYYKKPLAVHAKIKTEAKTNAPLFVILGASFSTWKRGTWSSKIVAMVEKNVAADAHFVAFPGLLTPKEILISDPKAPLLSGNEFANDVYFRLREYFLKLQSAKAPIDWSRVSLVGVSGGASVVINLLAVDAMQESRIFTGPALAMSPVLAPAHSFRVLDRGRRNALAGGVESAALTTLGTVTKGLLTRTGHEKILLMGRTTEDEATQSRFRHLFYNEFSLIDLRDTAAASHSSDFDFGAKKDGKDGNTYLEYFRDYTFPKHEELGWVPAGWSYERYIDPMNALKAVESPLMIVFSRDDPVLARVVDGQGGQELDIQNVLKQIEELENPVSLFAPERGAHMGYFLDSEWLALLFREVFAPEKLNP